MAITNLIQVMKSYFKLTPNFKSKYSNYRWKQMKRSLNKLKTSLSPCFHLKNIQKIKVLQQNLKPRKIRWSKRIKRLLNKNSQYYKISLSKIAQNRSNTINYYYYKPNRWKLNYATRIRKLRKNIKNKINNWIIKEGCVKNEKPWIDY